MANSKSGQRETDAAVEVLKDILITQLGLAGMSQQRIPRIVGCSIRRVNDIVKHRKEDKTDRIIELLAQILKVEAIQVATSSKGVTEGARLLKLAGLDNRTIADVLNTSPGTIRAVTANLRSNKRRR